MSYYRDEINAVAGRDLCAKAVTGKDGKIKVQASSKVRTIGDWSQLLSAARAVLGAGCGAYAVWRDMPGVEL